MADTTEFYLSVDFPDKIAADIADLWTKWNGDRATWLRERSELRSFSFATSTKTTQVGDLPWKNSTVTPKLTQIRDNLHANYMAALFPKENWFTWESYDKENATIEKRRAIESYMRTKLKASGYELLVSQLVYDYIDYGNVFVGHEFVNKTTTNKDGSKTVTYVGPRAFRISPMDCVINPTASSFENSPFLYRQLKSVGDLMKDVNTKPYLKYDKAVVEKIKKIRNVGLTNLTDAMKSKGLNIDGFSSLETYLNSGMVELIHFYGDYFDPVSLTLYENQIITIADRRFVLRNMTNESWNGGRPFFHCGWRLRPDNLWAQGPLDQLVGMQYRIDHLENLKADIFDQIAHPMIKVTGNTVDDFVYGPGETIHCGDEGDVSILHPDTTALNADMQIQDLMNKMEELAGAPKQAMGIRTPGEKTKYEVQTLENAAGRIFQSKASWFDKNINEPLLNSMLEDARQNLSAEETVGYQDPDFGVQLFLTITKKDLVGNGKLFAIGARHFAEQALFTQNLMQTLQIVEQLPDVKVHLSGKNIAKALEITMGWEQYDIYGDNIALAEQAESARLAQQYKENIQVEQQIPTDMTPVDQMQEAQAQLGNANEPTASQT